MTSREYVKNEQIIRLDCVKTNYTADHQAVWTLSSTTGLAFSDEAGGTEYSGTTRQADTVWVKVKEGCLLTSFKVTCSLEGLGERERTISASIPNFKPEYIQVVKAYEEVWSFPTSTADGPVKAGDMIIYVTEDANGVRQSTYRKFIGGDPSTASNWVSAVMTNSENSQLMIDGLYDALMEEASNASVLEMVKQLVAQYIAAQFINITGAIFGGPRYELQDDKVVDLGSGAGFYLSKEGVLNAFSAYLSNAFVNGYFETKDDSGIILKTQKESSTKTISIEETRWQESSIKNIVSAQNYAIYDSVSYENCIRSDSFDDSLNFASFNVPAAGQVSFEYKSQTIHKIVMDGTMNLIYVDIYVDNSLYDTYGSGTNTTGIQTIEPFIPAGNIKLVFRSEHFVGSSFSIRFATGLLLLYNGDFSIDNESLIYFSDNADNSFIEKNLNTPDFNSASHKFFSNIAQVVEGLAYGEYDLDYDTSTLHYNGVSYPVCKLIYTAMSVYFTLASGETISFSTQIDNSERANSGWYKLNGTITIKTSFRGLVTADLAPTSSENKIGTNNNPYKEGYISTLNGNVNTEATRTTYKVWGAVAN